MSASRPMRRCGEHGGADRRDSVHTSEIYIANGIGKKMWNIILLCDIIYTVICLDGGDVMNIELSAKEFRRLLDMVYIGNWILNSTRDNDRFDDYDLLQEKIFSLCPQAGMFALSQKWRGHTFPSKAFEDGGIHEAIADYEDAIFFDMLAEELASRDIDAEGGSGSLDELAARMDDYLDEFEKNGVTNLRVDL